MGHNGSLAEGVNPPAAVGFAAGSAHAPWLRGRKFLSTLHAGSRRHRSPASGRTEAEAELGRDQIDYCHLLISLGTGKPDRVIYFIRLLKLRYLSTNNQITAPTDERRYINNK